MPGEFRTSDGVRLVYDIDNFTDPWREAAPVILLHPAMGHAARFFAFVPHLARHYRVIRLDLRGHGRSEVPRSELTMARLVSDVTELMDEIGLESAHFVGNSAGGFVAQNVALTAPDRVLSLALFSSPPGLKHSQAASWIPRIRAQGLRAFLAATIEDRFPLDVAPPGLVRWFLDEAGKNDEDFICRFIALMGGLEWRDAVAWIKCPTLIVAPGHETVGGSEIYDDMVKSMPNARLLTYEGLPHNICDLVPDRCAGDVATFLSSIQDSKEA